MQSTARFPITITMEEIRKILGFLFLAIPGGLLDPSSLTRDQTHTFSVKAWRPNHRTAKGFFGHVNLYTYPHLKGTQLYVITKSETSTAKKTGCVIFFHFSFDAYINKANVFFVHTATI